MCEGTEPSFLFLSRLDRCHVASLLARLSSDRILSWDCLSRIRVWRRVLVTLLASQVLAHADEPVHERESHGAGAHKGYACRSNNLGVANLAPVHPGVGEVACKNLAERGPAEPSGREKT